MFAFERPEIPVERIVDRPQNPRSQELSNDKENPPRLSLSEEAANGQNAPSVRNAVENAPQHSIPEGEGNGSNQQNESADKNFFSLCADFFCSITEVLDFLFSLGKYTKSFRGEETRSGVEKFKKLGKKVFKMGKFFSLKCKPNFGFLSFNIQIINSSSQSEGSSPVRTE